MFGGTQSFTKEEMPLSKNIHSNSNANVPSEAGKGERLSVQINANYDTKSPFAAWAGLGVMGALMATTALLRGTCGPAAEWNYNKNDKTLTIYGKGAIKDRFSNDLDFKWNIEKIVVEEGIEKIGAFAFDCINVKEIKLPESLKKIGNNAFNGCLNLETIIIPKGVTNIEDSTFNDCNSLIKIVIPGTVNNIAQYAFNNCNLQIIYFYGTNEPQCDETSFAGCDKDKIKVIVVQDYGSETFCGMKVIKKDKLDTPEKEINADDVNDGNNNDHDGGGGGEAAAPVDGGGGKPVALAPAPVAAQLAAELPAEEDADDVVNEIKNLMTPTYAESKGETITLSKTAKTFLKNLKATDAKVAEKAKEKNPVCYVVDSKGNKKELESKLLSGLIGRFSNTRKNWFNTKTLFYYAAYTPDEYLTDE